MRQSVMHMRVITGRGNVAHAHVSMCVPLTMRSAPSGPWRCSLCGGPGRDRGVANKNEIQPAAARTASARFAVQVWCQLRGRCAIQTIMPTNACTFCESMHGSFTAVLSSAKLQLWLLLRLCRPHSHECDDVSLLDDDRLSGC
jgi:hypothetical protein